MEFWRRFCFSVVFAVWFGGLTFYATVVVEVGAEVAGSHRAFGFVTREVTNYINALGLAATLAVFLPELVLAWRASRARLATVAFVALVAAQVTLFVLHPRLDAMLDAETRAIISDGFYDLHRVYLLTSGLEWLAAMVFFGCALKRWCRVDPAREVQGPQGP